MWEDNRLFGLNRVEPNATRFELGSLKNLQNRAQPNTNIVKFGFSLSSAPQ